MYHHEFWKAINFGVKMSKIKITIGVASYSALGHVPSRLTTI